MSHAASTRLAGLRVAACMCVLALLAACSGGAPQQTAQYLSRAKHNYAPPGPPNDPWGPYITEAAARFDVPERWVREVMRVESGGHEFLNGQPITSGAGAMGLMQVMPATYEGLRAQYSLGDDPYDPHDNILAGTAYLRQMYDLYGSPGFLAAYNAGPGRLEDYLMRNRPLPDETRRYVAMIGPNIADTHPQNESPAVQMAMYQLPTNIPAGPRYPRGRRAPVALADNRRAPVPAANRTVVATALPEPPRPAPVQMAAAQPQPRPRPGFRLIPSAMADTLPARPVASSAAGGWAIQVGAFGNESQARTAAITARLHARDLLAHAQPVVGTVRSGTATLYRARLTGLSREAATQACERITHNHGGCLVLSPNAQS